MKVLFTCAYYPPEKAASIYLTENLTEDICKYGNYVDVYTPIPTRGVSAELRKYYKQHKVIRQHDGHLCVKRFFASRRQKSAIKGIALFLVQFISFALLFVEQIRCSFSG